ncbi:MAG: IS66 family insertion sequence element accessory protein TnpB [Tissierellia bacterium]|nr:IS66 family insertion sequence element accessory protein TnpB [Tissierellia bacterium]
MLNSETIDTVYLAQGVTDLRKSINGLALIVQETFKLDPFSKQLFVFCNRKKDKIKILKWDNDGFWLYYKRLENSKFNWPDGNNKKTIAVSDREFRWLLDGLNIVQEAAHKKVTQRIIV